MQALCFHEHGQLDVLRYQTVDKPQPKPGEVRVRVRACALNHLDIWVRRGWPGLRLDFPHWGGAEVAGEVDSLGAGVSSWSVGQRVVLDPGISTVDDRFTGRGEHSLSPGYAVLGEHVKGGLAEYIVVPASNLLLMPEGWDFVDASSTLLTGLTAWRMLIARARLRAGESVLIIGAGGGVNTMAIQIAKLAGATVCALTSSEEKMQKANQLGADVVLNYRQDPTWSKTLYRMTGRRGVDLVVDNVGAATLPQSMRAVARGGRIVIVGNTSGPHAELDTRYIFGKQISLIGSTMGSHEDFHQVMALVWAGKLQPVVDRVVPLSEGKTALAALERGEQFGKIVVTP
jgi:NADPH:quinone reductase-like Zn-dependent oxidoreductase